MQLMVDFSKIGNNSVWGENRLLCSMILHQNYLYSSHLWMMKRKRKPVSELKGVLLTLRSNEVKSEMEGQIKGGINLKFGMTSAVKVPEKQIWNSFIKLKKTPSIVTWTLFHLLELSQSCWIKAKSSTSYPSEAPGSGVQEGCPWAGLWVTNCSKNIYRVSPLH